MTEMHNEIIIAISGRICSGKSYVANMIASEYGFPIASFGRYLMYYCQLHNLSIDRKTLQTVGENLVIKNPRKFLIEVINFFIEGSNSIIIEGVRHEIILELIKQDWKKNISIYLEADIKTRFERYTHRKDDSDTLKSLEQFIVFDNHIVENEIEGLKKMSDFVIDTSKDYSEEMLKLVRQKVCNF